MFMMKQHPNKQEKETSLNMDKKLFLAIGRKLEERNVKELIRLRKRAVRYLKKSNKKSVKTD